MMNRTAQLLLGGAVVLAALLGYRHTTTANAPGDHSMNGTRHPRLGASSSSSTSTLRGRTLQISQEGAISFGPAGNVQVAAAPDRSNIDVTQVGGVIVGQGAGSVLVGTTGLSSQASNLQSSVGTTTEGMSSAFASSPLVEDGEASGQADADASGFTGATGPNAGAAAPAAGAAPGTGGIETSVTSNSLAAFGAKFGSTYQAPLPAAGFTPTGLVALPVQFGMSAPTTTAPEQQTGGSVLTAGALTINAGGMLSGANSLTVTGAGASSANATSSGSDEGGSAGGTSSGTTAGNTLAAASTEDATDLSVISTGLNTTFSNSGTAYFDNGTPLPIASSFLALPGSGAPVPVDPNVVTPEEATGVAAFDQAVTAIFGQL